MRWNSTRSASWTRGCTNTMRPTLLNSTPCRWDERLTAGPRQSSLIRSYSCPSTPVSFLPYNIVGTTYLSRPTGACLPPPSTSEHEYDVTPHHSSHTTKPHSSSCASCRSSPPSRSRRTPSRPPPSWKTHDPVGWKTHEKIRPRSHFTMYVEVRCPLPLWR
jgi:hypothetical protein